jgi:hypothetical protein
VAKKVLNELERKAIREETQGAAHALIDDLQHIREVVNREEPTSGDIRRLSNQLRRILVEGDLRKVAAPRLGRIELLGPDLTGIYRADRKRPFSIFSAGKARLCGSNWANFFSDDGPYREYEFNSDLLIPLRLDTFVSQRVIGYKGTWVSRGDVIKYVANVAHGVHTGTPREAEYKIINTVRNSVGFTLMNGIPTININGDPLNIEGPVKGDPLHIDLALIQLISAANLLTTSPDVLSLEREIGKNG